MDRRSAFGLIGGILVAVTVFLSGNTLTFSGDALRDTTSLVVFAAGILIAGLSLWGRKEHVGYAAMVPGTFALIGVIDLLREGSFSISVNLATLVVGVVLALLAAWGPTS